jgi:large subunit ribosomal protein L21
MNYAIIQFLGKQYLIQPNFWYDFPYIKKGNLDDLIFLKKILFLSLNNIIQIGYPYLKNIFIIGKIIQQKIKSKKILILKFKPKKHYKRIKGYRSFYTRLKIDFINKI